MVDEYELKQVKVRLKLAEAEPLYSTEQITMPDKAAEVMAGVLSQMDREYCCVVNLDGANHPSGSVQASREDIDVTKRLIEAGKIMNIPVLDHIISASIS